ncbi:hypothetical protein CRUP_007848, partial [Coryphaenoides rupestris]
MSDATAPKRTKVDTTQKNDKVDWRKKKDELKDAKKQRKADKLVKKFEKQKQTEADEKEQQVQHSQPSRGCAYTVSIALPGSVLDNAQSAELRTYLAGQIARACVVFAVDEIIVFDEDGEDVKSVEGDYNGVGKKGNACVQLARILQYLECPQYLRKFFFPKHPDLQYAGLLNPLDIPHHMRISEPSEYREGIVLDRPTKPGKGSLINCGMWKEVQIDKKLQTGLRVTVHINATQKKEGRLIKGVVVPPHLPRSEGGFYWGYNVRLASCLSISWWSSAASRVWRPVWTETRNLDVTDPSLLFDLYLNTCPSQGSRTIRTE